MQDAQPLLTLSWFHVLLLQGQEMAVSLGASSAGKVATRCQAPAETLWKCQSPSSYTC